MKAKWIILALHLMLYVQAFSQDTAVLVLRKVKTGREVIYENGSRLKLSTDDRVIRGTTQYILNGIPGKDSVLVVGVDTILIGDITNISKAQRMMDATGSAFLAIGGGLITASVLMLKSIEGSTNAMYVVVVMMICAVVQITGAAMVLISPMLFLRPQHKSSRWDYTLYGGNSEPSP